MLRICAEDYGSSFLEKKALTTEVLPGKFSLLWENHVTSQQNSVYGTSSYLRIYMHLILKSEHFRMHLFFQVYINHSSKRRIQYLHSTLTKRGAGCVKPRPFRSLRKLRGVVLGDYLKKKCFDPLKLL